MASVLNQTIKIKTTQEILNKSDRNININYTNLATQHINLSN